MTVSTAAERAYLITDPHLGRLATVGADGFPHVTPVGWAFDPDVTDNSREATLRFGRTRPNTPTPSPPHSARPDANSYARQALQHG